MRKGRARDGKEEVNKEERRQRRKGRHREIK